MDDKEQSQQGLTRRNLMNLVAVAAAEGLRQHLNPKSAKKTEPQKIHVVDKPNSLENTKHLEEAFLTHILNLPLFSSERQDTENAYVQFAQTLEQIDKGLWVLQNPSLRMQLIDKRWKLRLRGEANLKTLDEEKEKWSQKQGIHPETLAIAEEMYPKARDFVGHYLLDLRADLAPTQNLPSPDLFLINPGGMASLICYETGQTNPEDKLKYGFAYIGGGKAKDELNTAPNAFPNAVEALEKYCQLLQEITGLPFQPENIPGSLRGDPKINLSGGAIGLQFMPDTAWQLAQFLKPRGILFNVFDPNCATLAAYIFLARQEIVGKDRQGKPLWRYGYKRGDPHTIKLALSKWNPHQDQVETVYQTATDYYSRFLSHI